MAAIFVVVFAIVCACVNADIDGNLVFDDSPGMGRQFDGIGGLSGGGATSKLLVNYPQKQRDEILDYLFKPGFGAALQILKVEIGGDAQSTDGTEASHMHNEWEENYNRGYEWWLIGEAKKRNPDIKLVALPWTFPGWLGDGYSNSPYVNNTRTADYVTRWISGALRVHNFTTDYVGIWNERMHNVAYIKTLRAMLDARGYHHTKIMTADCNTKPQHYKVVDDVNGDPELQKALYALGFHYPGTISLPRAKHTGLAIWSSEDYSTRNDVHGASCWARLLNQNYVNGEMTATISWNLIAAYYDTLPFSKCGLMNAEEPWSGYYEVSTPIWITAHTTQFTQPGWLYLQHGSGVGLMPKGGSYVALTDPYGEELTIVIETMTTKDSQCIRGFVPVFDSAEQTVTIELKGRYSVYTMMNVWHTKLDFNGTPTMFMKKEPLQFTDRKAQLTIGVDEVYTLTTIKTGQKGNYPQPPSSKPFPLPYSDDFEAYSLYEEPYNLAQQIGSFEVLQDNDQLGAQNKFVRQMVLQTPIMWCPAESGHKSINVIGDANKWKDLFVEADIRIPTVNGSTGAYVAARVGGAGCGAQGANGVFLFASPSNYTLSSDLLRKNVTHSGPLSFKAGEWHKLSLFVMGNYAVGAFDGKTLFNVTVPPHRPGFAAIGTDSFGLADFDNFKLANQTEGHKVMTEYARSRSMYFVGEEH